MNVDYRCFGKTQYVSKAAALSCIRRRGKPSKAAGRKALNAYRCDLCKHWHVGRRDSI